MFFAQASERAQFDSPVPVLLPSRPSFLLGNYFSDDKGVRDLDVLHGLGALNKSADWFSQRVEPDKAEESGLDCLKGAT